MKRPKQFDSAVSRQYAKLQEAEAAARFQWDKVDKATRRLVRLAKMGRRYKLTVRISENRGLKIENQFKRSDKVFAPAFARKWVIKEVPLDPS